MIYQGSKKIPVTEIVIHCSATRPEWMAGRTTKEKVSEIRRWHIEDRGWKDIGYHWLIDRDGTIYRGRAENVIGAHVSGHNAGTIGVCLLGGFGSSEKDGFEKHYTRYQASALRRLLVDIGLRTKIEKITGHNQYDNKRACPGFYVPAWLKEAN